MVREIKALTASKAKENEDNNKQGEMSPGLHGMDGATAQSLEGGKPRTSPPTMSTQISNQNPYRGRAVSLRFPDTPGLLWDDFDLNPEGQRNFMGQETDIEKGNEDDQKITGSRPREEEVSPCPYWSPSNGV